MSLRSSIAAGLLGLLLAVTAAGIAAAAPPVVWTDQEGKTHATDQPPRRDQVTESEWRRLQSARPAGEGRVTALPSPPPEEWLPWLAYQAERLWSGARRFWVKSVLPSLGGAGAFVLEHSAEFQLGLRLVLGALLLGMVLPRLLRERRELRVLAGLPERTEAERLDAAVGRRVLVVGRPKRGAVGFDPHARNCLFFRKWREVHTDAADAAGAWSELRVDEREAPDFYLELGDRRVRVTLGRVVLRESRTSTGPEETGGNGLRERTQSVWIPYALQVSAAGVLERRGGELVLGDVQGDVELWGRALPSRTRRQVRAARRRVVLTALLLVLGGLGTAGPWLW